MRTETLIRELKRREILVQIIDSIIVTSYIYETGHKLRRGKIQEEIIQKLGLVRNNMLCALINDRMRAHGFTTIINRGDQYYRNINLRQSN